MLIIRIKWFSWIEIIIIFLFKKGKKQDVTANKMNGCGLIQAVQIYFAILHEIRWEATEQRRTEEELGALLKEMTLRSDVKEKYSQQITAT